MQWTDNALPLRSSHCVCDQIITIIPDSVIKRNCNDDWSGNVYFKLAGQESPSWEITSGFKSEWQKGANHENALNKLFQGTEWAKAQRSEAFQEGNKKTKRHKNGSHLANMRIRNIGSKWVTNLALSFLMEEVKRNQGKMHPKKQSWILTCRKTVTRKFTYSKIRTDSMSTIKDSSSMIYIYLTDYCESIKIETYGNIIIYAIIMLS